MFGESIWGPPPESAEHSIALRACASSMATDVSGSSEFNEDALVEKMIASRRDIIVKRVDPNAHMREAKSFKELNLCPQILQSVYDSEFERPFRIQEVVLPALFDTPAENIVIVAQRGSGKSVAIVLACLCKISQNYFYPQVLYLSPTHELTRHIGEVVKGLAQHCPAIKFRFATKGKDLNRMERISEQFLIGTPEKIFDWALRYRLFNIKKIKVFVLDDTDTIVTTKGHENHVFRILRALTKNCQIILSSLAYNDKVMEFVERHVLDPVIIRLRREETISQNIKHYYIVYRNSKEKFSALSSIYRALTKGQAIVFCNTKETASLLNEELTQRGHALSMLSGALTLKQRSLVRQRFKEGKDKILITTPAFTKVIHVDQVSLIVNFDLIIDQKHEADCDIYSQRICLLGQHNKPSLMINMIDGKWCAQLVKELENHFEIKIRMIDPDIIREIMLDNLQL